MFSSCWFDAEKCEEGLNALANYQYVWDERYDTFRQTPLHNWASNGADAFRQFAQGYAPDDHSIKLEFKSEW
jgi:phage terminase large subunit